jgi:hypothetical protein
MIKDLNRGRKVYSFFRARPAPLSVVNIEQIISGGEDMLTFDNIAALAAYNVQTNSKDTGQLGFVKTIRDYWYLDRELAPNLGTPDNITVVSASGGGMWYRMGLGRVYWQNMEATWVIDPSGGDDENYGDYTAPLKTQFEQLRRMGHVTVGASGLGHTYNFIAGWTETSSSTPQVIYTFLQPTRSLVRYHADFNVVTEGGAFAAATAFVEGTYFPTGGLGGPTLQPVGAQTSGAEALPAAGSWGCSMAASGTSVVFAVTGSGGSTQFWMLNLQIEQLGD